MSIIEPQSMAACVLAERRRQASTTAPRRRRPPAEPATGVRRHTAATLRRLAARIEPTSELGARS